MTDPVPYVPADSATYLEGGLPGYQGDDTMNVGGELVKMNDLTNHFDPHGNGGLPPYMTPATKATPSPLRLRPMLWPAGDYDGEFVDPQLPSGLFMIRFDGGEDAIDGPYDGSTFIVDPETNIAYSSNYPGSPIYIRATEREGSHLEIIKGDGTLGTMDLLPYEPDGEEI
jgi:hypothetical protein